MNSREALDFRLDFLCRIVCRVEIFLFRRTCKDGWKYRVSHHNLGHRKKARMNDGSTECPTMIWDTGKGIGISKDGMDL